MNLSFRTEESKRKNLDKVAHSLDRNRNWVINAAIDNFLELHTWQMREIAAGIAESDSGKGIPLAEIEKRFAAKRKKRPRAKTISSR